MRGSKRAPRDVSVDLKSRPPPLCEILNTPLRKELGPEPEPLENKSGAGAARAKKVCRSQVLQKLQIPMELLTD